MISRNTTIRTTAAFAALIFLSACAETASDPVAPQNVAGPDQAAFNTDVDDGHGHVMMTRGQLERLNAASGHGGGGTGIFYHGGPVLQAGTNVAAVYWASLPIFVNGPAAGTTGTGAGDGSLV